MLARCTALCFVLATFLSPSQTALLAQEPLPEEETSTTVSVRDVVHDELIENRLDRILTAAGWFETIEVQSSEGVVTLSGTADTDEHREWAANLARKTEDVVAVINKLDAREDVDFQSSRSLIQSSISRLWKDFLLRSPLLIGAAIVLLITALLSKLTTISERRLLEGRRLRSSLKDLIYQLSSIGVWVIGFFTAIIIAFPGMTPAKALTTLGLGTVAIGFAFKDIFENFFAGVLILWRYPFDRGDFIQCGDLIGKVEEITIRNTLIRRLDGELAVVPNAHIFKNNVDILTSQPQRRVRIICGVAYGENVDEAREVIRTAVQGCDSVQGKRTVEVFAQEFADSSINFEVAWWTGSKPIDIRSSRDEVVAAIKRELDNAGIEIPFPYRTLTFQDAQLQAAITQQIANAQSSEDDR